MIFGYSRTIIDRSAIFIGDKTSTINSLTSLIQLKNQWTYYMEYVLQLVSVNSGSERGSVVLKQENSFPFLICDISLPDCQTGFVYFFFPFRDPTFYYIRMTNYIYRRINKHNSGFGYQSTIPPQLRLFAVFAFVL